MPKDRYTLPELHRTSDVFIPPQIEHDPLDDLTPGNEKKEQPEPGEKRRRLRRKKKDSLRRRRRRKKRSRLAIAGGVLGVLVLWLLLRVAPISFGTLLIEGNEALTAEDVRRAAGVPGYVNVIQLSPDDMQERMQKDLRISAVTVKREFPAAIRITLTERKAAAVVRTLYGFAYVDAKGTVMDIQPQIQGISVPIITGTKMDALLLGDTISDGPIARGLAYLQELPPDILKTIAEVNVGNETNLIAYTSDSLPIYLGTGDHPAERAKLTEELLQEVQQRHMMVQYIDTDIRAPLVKSK
ncbi:cell division protein FtsQ/DivIB [uncultured Megasphaera sp.]|uniref:cell division protein FtsQ/DivIB n=1 Tax=uncultured Megasphaera sp. TaxID=165188 RepID=UPI002659CB8D|nr:FtsQ-type POTRA domain-containing protein [uncultured Megasphaera sp.]